MKFRRKPESQANPSLRSAMQRTQSGPNVRTRGSMPNRIADGYHTLMRTSPARVWLLFSAGFIVFNLIFAGLFWLDPNGLSMPHEHTGMPRYWRDFFFSVHTVATIGYGNVFPVSTYANIVVVVEITLGIALFALTTGIAFARFSRPTARILFSRVMVVRDYGGVPTLMFRAANQRHNLIFEAAVRVSILADEDVAGTRMRRFRDLKLVRHSNPVFLLTWTVMHAIDQDSPLRGWLDNPDAAGNAEIIAVLSGTDDASGQTIHGRWAYSAADIRWDAQFEDIIGLGDDGVRTIDYTRFHDTVAPR